MIWLPSTSDSSHISVFLPIFQLNCPPSWQFYNPSLLCLWFLQKLSSIWKALLPDSHTNNYFLWSRSLLIAHFCSEAFPWPVSLKQPPYYSQSILLFSVLHSKYYYLIFSWLFIVHLSPKESTSLEIRELSESLTAVSLCPRHSVYAQ